MSASDTPDTGGSPKQGKCIQGVPEKTLVSVQRPITQVWKQLLGQVGAVFKSSGYQLSFEPKKSRIM